MRSFSTIQLEKQDRIAYITLSRAEKKNALNNEIVNELTDAFSILDSDIDIKVIILKADGDVFSAGADLQYLQNIQNFSFEENLADSNSLKELFLKIYTHKKIVIARVEGHAIAGGCGLTTVCDFCFAVPEARFGYTEVRIGFIPAIVSVFLARKISGTKMRELLLTGRLISANEAVSINLINGEVPKNSIASYVKEFALKLCEDSSAQSISSIKELLFKTSSPELENALDIASQMNARARLSEDCKKGIAAFLNSEKIKW